MLTIITWNQVVSHRSFVLANQIHGPLALVFLVSLAALAANYPPQIGRSHVSPRSRAGITDLAPQRTAWSSSSTCALGDRRNRPQLGPEYRLFLDLHSPVSFTDPDIVNRYGGNVESPERISADVTFEFRLADRPSSNPSPIVWRATDPRLRQTMIRDWTCQGLDSRKLRVWAGICDDPFIFFRFSTTTAWPSSWRFRSTKSSMTKYSPRISMPTVEPRFWNLLGAQAITPLPEASTLLTAGRWWVKEPSCCGLVPTG